MVETAVAYIDSSFEYGVGGEARAASPAFADAYKRCVEAISKPDVLSPVVRELIGLAVNAAPTHLNRDAVVAHVNAAREHGASDEEILATLQLAACLGIHALTFGAAMVREESSEFSQKIAAPLSARQQELKQRWIDQRDSWLPGLDAPLAGDLDFFEATAEIQNIPVAAGVLSPKVRELIYVALDSSITHMHWGTRVHIRLALKHGATYEEVLATLEITSLIGVQGYGWGIAALADHPSE